MLPPESSSSSKTPISQDYKLWLMVAGLFLVVIVAWTVLISVARANQPEVIELEPTGETSRP